MRSIATKFFLWSVVIAVGLIKLMGLGSAAHTFSNAYDTTGQGIGVTVYSVPSLFSGVQKAGKAVNGATPAPSTKPKPAAPVKP